jgi:hypothetical protein
MMKKFLFTLSLLASSPLFGEVEEVKIQWTPALCNEICAMSLYRQFKRIYNVEEVTVSQLSGQASLRYKKKAYYDFGPVNRAMEMIGLTINDIRVIVKGRIKYTTKEVFLISDGDGTIFNLLSPVPPQPQVFVENYNPDTHRLTVQNRNQLIEAGQNNSLVTISGPLFEPERAPPNYLIVEGINVAKPETKPSSSD